MGCVQLTSQTDPEHLCRECQVCVGPLVEEIVAAASEGDGEAAAPRLSPGYGTLTTCRCPAPCNALVIYLHNQCARVPWMNDTQVRL